MSFLNLAPGTGRVETGKISDNLILSAVRKVCQRNGWDDKTSDAYAMTLFRSSNSSFAQFVLTHRDVPETIKTTPIVLPMSLTDRDKSSLREYGVGYDLQFVDGYRHDHPLAAAMRAIDYAITAESIFGNFSDVGGNPLYYMRHGREDVHCCNPIVDAKDYMRRTQRDEAMWDMLESAKDPVRRQYLKRWCDKDPALMCEKIAQECTHQSEYLRAIHVYDIPIDDWPDIIERKGAKAVSGCMLFDKQVYFHDAGSMPIVDARWEVNREKDEFRMGFARSHAWWYVHKFSDYARYGHSQLLRSSSGCNYIYNITQVRGSTIFYTIFKAACTIQPPTHVIHESTKVIQVEGYDLGRMTDTLIPKTWVFPEGLWNKMVNYCTLKFEKGSLNTQEALNMYRTLVAVQVVNGVQVSGGETLPDECKVPFVVHASLAAAIATTVARRETKYLTEAALRTRGTVWEKIVHLVKSCIGSYSDPISQWLTRIVDNKLSGMLVNSFVIHPPVLINAMQVLPVLNEQPQRLLLPQVHPQDVIPEFSDLAAAWESTVGVRSVPDSVHAIAEHIDEITSEDRVVHAALSMKMRRYLRGGSIDTALLQDYVEDDKKPDFLQYVDGVLQKRTVLGRKTCELEHSACMLVSTQSIVSLGSVPVDYSGFAFITDDLLIYNGPELVAGLKKALELPQHVTPKVVLRSGPPGCGKTTAIVEAFNRDTDVVLCPVKESIVDTAERLVKCGKLGVDEVREYARTVDSYLMHCVDTGMRPNRKRLLFDECYMTHAGRIYAAALLLGVEEVVVFGDPMQIPHVTRSDFFAARAVVAADEHEPSYVTYRCPPQAVAAWNHLYDGKIRSKSKVEGSMVACTIADAGRPPKDTVVLVMYQADKKEAQKHFGQSNKILSVHESQGKTFKNVWLLRTDARRRLDKVSLFDRDAYVLVALSRHTHDFRYVRPADVGDSVSKFLAKVTAQNVHTAKSSSS